MKKRIYITATTLMMAFCLTGTGWSQTPSGVEATKDAAIKAVQTLPTQEPEGNSVMLMDRLEYTLTPEGEVLFDELGKIKLLTQSGVDEYSMLFREFNSSKESLELVEAYVEDAKGKKRRYTQKDFEYLDPLENSAYTTKWGRLSLNDLKVGDTLFFHFRSKREYLEPNRFWGVSYFENLDPNRSPEMVLRAPKGSEIHVGVVGLDKIDSKVYQEGDETVYEWKAKDLAAVQVEELSGRVLDNLGRVEFSSYSSLEDYAKSYFSNWSSPSDVVLTKIEGFEGFPEVIGGQSKIDRLLAIAKFLEDRYEIVNLSETILVPVENLDAVVESKVLSTVDMANLLLAFGEKNGVTAYPSLTVLRSTLDRGVGAPDKGDFKGLLLTLKGEDGPLYWDPEHPGLVTKNAPKMMDQAKAYEWDGRQIHVRELTSGESWENTQSLSVDTWVSPKGHQQMVLEWEAQGLAADEWIERAQKLNAGTRQTQDANSKVLFTALAKTVSPRARVTEGYFPSNDELESGHFELWSSLNIQGLPLMGDKSIAVPLPSMSLTKFKGLISEGERQSNAYMLSPMREEYKLHVKLPEGSTFVDPASDLNINIGPLHYSRVTVVKGTELWAYYVMEASDSYVTKEEAREFKRVLERVGNIGEVWVRFHNKEMLEQTDSTS